MKNTKMDRSAVLEMMAKDILLLRAENEALKVHVAILERQLETYLPKHDWRFVCYDAAGKPHMQCNNCGSLERSMDVDKVPYACKNGEK